MTLNYVSFSNDDDWFTPKWIVDKFGQFDYDPATNKIKANEFNIKNYDTIETNGLSKNWTKYKRIWINPPFTKKKEFLSKAVECYEKTKNEIYFLLPIQFLTTKTFHNICKGGKIFLPNGRICFEKFDKTKNSPAFGSVIIKIQNTWEIEILEIRKG